MDFPTALRKAKELYPAWENSYIYLGFDYHSYSKGNVNAEFIIYTPRALHCKGKTWQEALDKFRDKLNRR